MKKLFLLLIILPCLPVLVYGQGNAFTLSGKVTDCRTHAGIENAIVKLVCSDGRSISVFTDTAGYYSFDSVVLKINREYVVSAGAGDLSNTTKDKSRRGYMSSSERSRFSTNDHADIKNIQRDFA